MGIFAEKLIGWYRENRRDLPWRDTRDPYRIWISEIILQQTRVAQGYDYYCRFIKRFPDVQALAAADAGEVMKLWQGLGYYSRARNLHEAARSVAAAGKFPDTYQEVRRLKGVGDYTAAAICSFAYGMPCAVVDGNVYRVISRWMGVEEPIDTVAGKKLFAALAQELMGDAPSALYNQAIMDFGALQCVPSSPSCLLCPLAETCVALRKGLVGALPRKQRKTKVSDRFFHYFYAHTSDYTFLHKREGGDIWEGLYEFPLLETMGRTDENDLFFLPECRSLFQKHQVVSVAPLGGEMKHVLSHRVIYARCYDVELAAGTSLQGPFVQVSLADLQKFPVSRLISRFFSLILKPDN